MLTMDHVSKRFGASSIIEDACVRMGTGVTGLIAPNGAGKSTLIKMLATLLFPSEGQICWKGTDIHALGEAYRAPGVSAAAVRLLPHVQPARAFALRGRAPAYGRAARGGSHR